MQRIHSIFCQPGSWPFTFLDCSSQVFKHSTEYFHRFYSSRHFLKCWQGNEWKTGHSIALWSSWKSGCLKCISVLSKSPFTTNIDWVTARPPLQCVLFWVKKQVFGQNYYNISHPVIFISEYSRLDAKNNMRLGVMPRPLTINRIMTKFSAQYSHLAERLNSFISVCQCLCQCINYVSWCTYVQKVPLN